MREMLMECCQILLEKLTELHELGEITNEEFEEHAKAKREFLEKRYVNM